MLNNDVNKRLVKLKDALISLGYSHDEAQKQIDEVGEIAVMALLGKLIKDFPNQKEEIVNQTEKFISNKFPAGEFQLIVDEVSNETVKQYIYAVIENIDDEKKKRFLEKITY